VRIDVLSLPGGSRARGAAIGDALRSELARVLGDARAQSRLREVASSGAATPVLDAGRMRLPPAERAGRLGTRLATQVATSLLGQTPRSRR